MAENSTGKRDKALGFINQEGPVLPIQIGKELSVDTMFAGAILSELVNEGKLEVTNHLRVGGSPVYYVKGQESKLESYMKHLNENDIRTLQILKEKGIMRDKDCSPLQRVSYRIVKDFAKSLVLKKDSGDKEVFWRYYLVDEDAAKEKILDIVNRKDEKKEAQKTVEEFEEKPLEKEEVLEKPEVKAESQEIEEKPKPRLKKDSSVDIVKEFFRINGITIWEEKVIRKDKDINYVISFDTRLGNLKYFAKFRDKKIISEGDISLAYNEAGKLPLMFLSKGELTKPAKKLIETDFKGVIFKRVQ